MKSFPVSTDPVSAGDAASGECPPGGMARARGAGLPVCRPLPDRPLIVPLLVPARRAVLLLAAALLPACGGGGGGGGGSSGAASRCIPTQIFGCLSPSEFGRHETTRAANHRTNGGFSNQWGLGTIRADRAWARLELAHGDGVAPGTGQTAGLIDSGIDTGHPLFAGKAVSEAFLLEAVDEDGTRASHGTAVASVIAARPSAPDAAANAARGVAWGADIAMFAVPTSAGGGNYRPISLSALSGADSRWNTITGAAIDWRGGGRQLDFVNVSLGFKGIIDQYTEAQLRTGFGTAISRLAQAGRAGKTVFVFAAGNAHGQPCDPADFTDHADLCRRHRDENNRIVHRVDARSVGILAGLPVRIAELRNHVVAVAAIGRDGSIAYFSNRCGIAARWCLAAPGHDVRLAYYGPHPDTNAPGVRGVFDGSGTSYAAPMVTGALIAMKHYFRDQLSNAALVSRMLRTANRSGIYGVSATYGQGLLDLDAATRPAGAVVVALGDTVGGPGGPLAQTRLGLGSAFGDGPAAALAGQEIAVFDALGAPFWFALDGFAHAAPRTPAAERLDAFLAPLPDDRPGRDGRTGGPPLLGGFVPAPGGDRRRGARLGYLDAPAAGRGPGAGGGGHLSLAGGALAFDAGGPGGLGLTAFSTEGMRGRAPVSGALLSWRPAPTGPGGPAGGRPGAADRPALRLTAGWIAERDTLLGSRAAGAFGRLSSGAAFVGFDGGMQAGAWRLDAGAEIGMARAAPEGGLLTGVTPLYSSAFALRAGRPLADGSTVQVSVSQPLRVEAGRARLSVPTGRTKDGRVLRRRLSAGLAPAGRQIDLSARWRKRLANGGDLRLGASWTLHPGHDAAAPAEFTMMVGYRHSF